MTLLLDDRLRAEFRVEGNWPILVREYQKHHAQSPRLKTLAVTAYLQAVGAALTLRDEFVLGL